MSQPIQIACPHCNQHLKVAGATAGKQVRCPQCHGFVQVPDSATPTSPRPNLWLVRTEDGKIYGPVSREEMELWIGEGRVSSQCHVTPDGAQQWMWAGEMFPNLAAPPSGTPFQPLAYHAPGPVSEKSRLVAGLLGLLLPLVGFNGIHRLYTGHIGMGILMLITCGGCGIWQLIDVILVFAGGVRDADGRPLRD